jgi:hypothetical protein
VASLRGSRALRSWIARLCLLAPGLAIVVVDVAVRHARLAEMETTDKAIYGVSAAFGAVFWGGLLAVSAEREGAARWVARTLLIAGAGLAVGGQIYAFGRYDAYLNAQSVLVGTSMMPSVGQQLWFDRATLAKALLPPVLLVGLLAVVRARWAAARPWRAAVGSDLATVSLVIIGFVCPVTSEQGASPDVLYLHGMAQLLRARWDHNECVERVHPGPRTPTPLPALTPHPAAPRNVMLVLTESVRAMSVCVGYDKDCVYTPFSNAAAPNRIPLRQLRAVDSTTAISLAVMWSGLLPTESRKALHTAPLIFEYAHAANIDTAYWTSQNLLFGNSGAWLDGLPFDHHVSATQLEEEPTMETGADDGKLVDYAVGALAELHEPFLGVVHLSNTHFPYAIDDDDAPFKPESGASGPGYETEIRNRYQDSIYLQDRGVARLIRAVRARPEGARTVIVFISDHGEQMREKGAVGHTGTLYEPEIRIPAWVDAPPGTLTEGEEAHLRALADAPLTSLDVMPTLLDLVGLWDAPEIGSFRAKMSGQSLLRGGSSPDRAVVLTNCSELWACAFKNWGAMRGTRKLIANQADRAWNCFDVANDPDEVDGLDVDEECGDLKQLAEGTLHGRPF